MSAKIVPTLVFRLDLLLPRYLSADNDNEVYRLHKHLHTKTLPKDGKFQKGKKSSKKMVTTIAETGILCSVTSPRRHLKKKSESSSVQSNGDLALKTSLSSQY